MHCLKSSEEEGGGANQAHIARQGVAQRERRGRFSKMGVWIGGRRMKNISGPSDPEQHMQTGADWTGGTLASDGCS